MKKLLYKLRPTSGSSHIAHLLLNALLPVAALMFVRIDFAYLAAGIVLLSKWRMFAVRPRYWIPNLRSNLVDIFVGLSVVAFMDGTLTLWVQVAWAVFYLLWLVWLKPKSQQVAVMAQALIAQTIVLVAFYSTFQGNYDNALIVYVLVVWLACYASARHFLGAFDEPLIRPMTHIWAWFGATMAWVTGHWVVDYLGIVPQIGLIIAVMGYGLATLYYFDKNGKLKLAVKQQLIWVMAILLLIIIILSDWKGKTL